MKTSSTKRAIHILLLAAVLLATPALCAWLGGYDEIWEGVKNFPPRTEDWGLLPEKLWNKRCPFSWPWFIGMAAFTFACMLPLVRRAVGRAGDRAAKDVPSPGDGLSADGKPFSFRHSPMPWWGWFGIVELAVAWTFAWGKFDFCRDIQPHISYWPLWLGYILIVNALCVKRGGNAPLVKHTGPYLLSFPVSSLFWWFFEYLNRYVWNWWYKGVQQMSGGEYAFYATVCFSSVLPAVAATAALLHAFRPFRDIRFSKMWSVDVRHPASIAFFAAVSALGLTGIVFWPDRTFALLWLSPLFAFLLVQFALGEPCVLDRLRTGDWSLVFRFAIAALVCGLAWETWNYFAVAKWVYSVPWVQRFQIWEMPLVGFAGYLPFGVECAAVTAWILPEMVDD